MGTLSFCGVALLLSSFIFLACFHQNVCGTDVVQAREALEIIIGGGGGGGEVNLLQVPMVDYGKIKQSDQASKKMSLLSVRKMRLFNTCSNGRTNQMAFSVARGVIAWSHGLFMSPERPIMVKYPYPCLRFNSFYGMIPPQVFTLDPDVLFINNNNFIGSIPDNLGSTPVLYLTLANNKLVGPIPRSIGRASKTLVEVLFLNNQLSGCLPYEIGLLKIATVFDVGFNQLTGPIPHSFACLDKIQELNLAQNQFYGPVPEMVCTLRNLVNLSLSYNYFTQVGPECRKLIKSNRLDVRMNCILDLPKQRSAAECAAFFSKPRNCPDEKSFSFIPCWNSVHPNSLEPSDRRSMAPVAPPMSYGSLIPHRL
ncbi:uncharacterized protein At4g06744-like isoform X3 [Actinidia eriantha]|uniref:uncharacterized protein At4g06744-like isoform X3 n=1 Tax=Actinidia eriantha TaxID=165200 RepID=UPI00258F0A67|nr:uncharacterized protein At4g06744-like isoform X3 [Actinidia eriantha]